MDTVVGAFGGLDILVNNAGVALPTNTGQDEDDFLENWERTVAVNQTAHVHLVRLALPHFRAAGAGRVVNIASTESILTTRRDGRLHGDQGRRSSASRRASPSSSAARASPSTASARGRSAPA